MRAHRGVGFVTGGGAVYGLVKVSPGAVVVRGRRYDRFAGDAGTVSVLLLSVTVRRGPPPP
ncbi:hypothetical protein Saso_05090 [Streptomyces asoensis]|uniref:Uncharacterized protein n=1 Tax=Streptomyces asoensis TaxID=249586 RepID=A0ABQ3RSM8_9ACTN|nr:hypothetical protein GCM10010496_06020 [Streptomyces asoensis]GHI58859.1 hypothetical protein Saso_05090 [Streptomyces asoensis]